MSEDLYSTPEHESFRRTVRRFVEQDLAPRAREFDRRIVNVRRLKIRTYALYRRIRFGGRGD